jgi:hypothetical protein
MATCPVCVIAVVADVKVNQFQIVAAIHKRELISCHVLILLIRNKQLLVVY